MGVSVSLLSMWVVYDHPRDMPDHFVARRHEVHPRGPVPTGDVIKGNTLGEVRARLPPGLYRMPRDPNDEPQIVEVWM